MNDELPEIICLAGLLFGVVVCAIGLILLGYELFVIFNT